MSVLSINQNSFTLEKRLRRNRKSAAIRSLIRETSLLRSDLIMPFFLLGGKGRKEKIESMPGVHRMSLDHILNAIDSYHQLGIQAFALFPVLEKEKKCPQGIEALNAQGMLPRAIRAIKKEFPEICLIADIALDPFTSHGHDGVISDDGKILNDETLQALGEMALIQADAGVDIVAPSDMMDGRVGYLRKALDSSSFTDTSILSYSAKYSSSFYSPFREALGSSLSFGDKKTYQMDPANSREAILEALFDEEEGADILMIKPASLYLDIISKIREATNKPVAAFHVSGEYSMVMAAHAKGFLDADAAFYETLLSIKRAGADMIFSYAIDSALKFI